MYPTGYVITNDVDFDNAILFLIPVEVYRDGKLIDCGFILRHSDFVVRFATPDRTYVKASHEFRIKTLEDIRNEQK